MVRIEKQERGTRHFETAVSPRCTFSYANLTFFYICIFAVNQVILMRSSFFYDPVCLPFRTSLLIQWKHCVSLPVPVFFVYLPASDSLTFHLQREICLRQDKLRACCCYYNNNLSQIIAHDLGLQQEKKWSFSLRISSVNVTKSAVSCGFGHIYKRNP